jgi:hypothetical protein
MALVALLELMKPPALTELLALTELPELAGLLRRVGRSGRVSCQDAVVSRTGSARRGAAGTVTGRSRGTDSRAREPGALAAACLGMGTVTATSSPRASAARAMTAIPTPEVVCDSSSMASVEMITVHEP